MFAPIQPRDIRLVESHVSANPEFDSQRTRFAPWLHVRGTVLSDPFEGDDALNDATMEETDFIPFHLDVETVFTKLPQGEAEDEDSNEASAVFYRVVLLLSINEEEEHFERSPYRAELALYGDFEASRVPTDKEERKRVFRILRANGASMLYSTARQWLGQNTRSSIHPELLLPALSFREIIEHESAVEEAKAAPDEGVPAEEE